MYPAALVLGGGYGLGEGDVVAAGLLVGDFAHAVEGGTLGLHNFCALQGGEKGVQIVDFDVKERWPFFDLGDEGRVFCDTDHNFGT